MEQAKLKAKQLELQKKEMAKKNAGLPSSLNYSSSGFNVKTLPTLVAASPAINSLQFSREAQLKK